MSKEYLFSVRADVSDSEAAKNLGNVLGYIKGVRAVSFTPAEDPLESEENGENLDSVIADILDVQEIVGRRYGFKTKYTLTPPSTFDGVVAGDETLDEYIQANVSKRGIPSSRSRKFLEKFLFERDIAIFRLPINQMVEQQTRIRNRNFDMPQSELNELMSMPQPLAFMFVPDNRLSMLFRTCALGILYQFKVEKKQTVIGFDTTMEENLLIGRI